MVRALDLKPEVTQECGFESRLRQEVSTTEVSTEPQTAPRALQYRLPTAPLGWVKCREHISLCIIVYVTNKAHLKDDHHHLESPASMLSRLCWETHQTFWQWHVLICHPGGVPMACIDLPSWRSAYATSVRSIIILSLLPPCSRDCAGRHTKPSGNGMYWFAILEELDCLCNLCKVQVLPPATSSETDPNQMQN